MSTWDAKAGRVIYISYISHFVVRVQLADLNWWVVFNLSSCGLHLPLSATQQLSHRILTNKNRKRHIPYAYMNNIHHFVSATVYLLPCICYCVCCVVYLASFLPFYIYRHVSAPMYVPLSMCILIRYCISGTVSAAVNLPLYICHCISATVSAVLWRVIEYKERLNYRSYKSDCLPNYLMAESMPLYA
jgi:hypothetical protein